MAYRISVVGASGLVGQKMIEVLYERKIPIDKLYPFSSLRSAGMKTDFFDERMIELIESNIPECDFALFAVDADLSYEWAPRFVNKGAIVIDNSSAFRMDDDIPLVVPEVNLESIPEKPSIIANPNCSTIQLVVALKPLDAIGIRRVHVSTYQAVSGAGKEAVETLLAQAKGANENGSFERRIHGNVIPQIGPFLENGFCKEELKLVNETRKILNNPELIVYPTVVRVPVINGHSESVSIDFDRETSAKEVSDILKSASGVVVTEDYFTPDDLRDTDDTFVSRIRQIEDDKKSIQLWIVADNIRKGAASNAVQIMQALIQTKRLDPHRHMAT